MTERQEHQGHQAGGEAVVDLGRLGEVSRYDLVDDGLRAELDVIARRSAERLGQPLGLVSIVLDQAQVFAGQYGLDGWLLATRGTPIEWSFCVNMITGEGPYLVSDATTDPRHADNPLVTVDGIRCYAGVPLRTRSGHVLGSHCVIGNSVHEFTAADVAVLESGATDTLTVLQRHRRRPDLATAVGR